MEGLRYLGHTISEGAYQGQLLENRLKNANAMTQWYLDVANEFQNLQSSLENSPYNSIVDKDGTDIGAQKIQETFERMRDQVSSVQGNNPTLAQEMLKVLAGSKIKLDNHYMTLRRTKMIEDATGNRIKATKMLEERRVKGDPLADEEYDMLIQDQISAGLLPADQAEKERQAFYHGTDITKAEQYIMANTNWDTMTKSFDGTRSVSEAIRDKKLFPHLTEQDIIKLDNFRHARESEVLARISAINHQREIEDKINSEQTAREAILMMAQDSKNGIYDLRKYDQYLNAKLAENKINPSYYQHYREYIRMRGDQSDPIARFNLMKEIFSGKIRSAQSIMSFDGVSWHDKVVALSTADHLRRADEEKDYGDFARGYSNATQLITTEILGGMQHTDPGYKDKASQAFGAINELNDYLSSLGRKPTSQEAWDAANNILERYLSTYDESKTFPLVGGKKPESLEHVNIIKEWIWTYNGQMKMQGLVPTISDEQAASWLSSLDQQWIPYLQRKELRRKRRPK